MTDAPSRYPLAWPAGRSRKTWQQRKSGNFRAGNRLIGVSSALSRLSDEIERLGGKHALLSSNYEARVDGSLILNRGAPADPGVCAYFHLKDKPYALACDTYGDVAQNIAAVAAHIEATRRIERHGVATAAETLQAFSALPPPAPSTINLPAGTRPWREVLGFDSEWPGGHPKEVAIELLQKRWRAKSIEALTEAEQKDLNIARDAALSELAV